MLAPALPRQALLHVAAMLVVKARASYTVGIYECPSTHGAMMDQSVERRMRDVGRGALLVASLWLVAASTAACGGAAYDAAAPSYAAQGAAPAEPAGADMAVPAEMAPPPASPGGGPVPEQLAPPPGAPGPAPAGAAGAPARAAAPAAKLGDAAPTSVAKGPSTHGAARAKQDDRVDSKSQPSVAQMLIYTAQLRIQVAKQAFAETIDRVVDLAVGMGGFIAKHDNTTVQVRVPSLRFREALKEMEKLGKVSHRAVQAQDVTEEYHDLSVRLKSLRATRDRLEQFLNRAKNIQEVLAVEKELDRINTEIDRIEGRMRFLASRAAFSTITVALEPKPESVVVADPDQPPPPPPPPRTLRLPIEWLSRVGLDQLLDLD